MKNLNTWLWSWFYTEETFEISTLYYPYSILIDRKAKCKQAQIRFNMAKKKKENEILNIKKEISSLLEDNKERIALLKVREIQFELISGRDYYWD